MDPEHYVWLVDAIIRERIEDPTSLDDLYDRTTRGGIATDPTSRASQIDAFLTGFDA